MNHSKQKPRNDKSGLDADRQYAGATSWLPANVAPAVLAMSLSFASPVNADMSATTDHPAFSQSDINLITRNELLRETLPNDAWLVFKIVRLLDDLKHQSSNRSGALPDLDLNVEPEDNPDLGAIQRVAPEAAQDLFQLIKQAEKQKGEHKKGSQIDDNKRDRAVRP